jgi:hypothetical protein
VSDNNLARRILGTSRNPRYGSGWSIGLLGGLGVLFVLFHSWILAILFFVLAAGALFVRSVRGSTRR